MTDTMTPSEIAAYFDTWKNGKYGAWASQAAATIREQAEAIKECRHNHECALAAWSALDERTGSKLKIATEALEWIVHTAREMVGTGTAVDTDTAYAWAVALKATTDEADQALARIKEVG